MASSLAFLLLVGFSFGTSRSCNLFSFSRRFFSCLARLVDAADLMFATNRGSGDTSLKFSMQKYCIDWSPGTGFLAPAGGGFARACSRRWYFTVCVAEYVSIEVVFVLEPIRLSRRLKLPSMAGPWKQLRRATAILLRFGYIFFCITVPHQTSTGLVPTSGNLSSTQ